MDNEHRLPAPSESRLLVELKARERALAEYDPYYPGEPEADALDLAGFGRILVKRKWTVMSVLLLVLAAVMMGTFLKRPVYRASATIQIEEQSPRVLEYQPLEAQQGAERNFYPTQYEILRSRTLAAAVIDELDLLKDPEIGGQVAQRGLMSGVQQLVALARDAIEGAAKKQSPLTPQEQKAEAVDRFLERLEIEPVRNSKLVQVTFSAFDPALASRAANTLVDEYIQSNFARRYQAGEQARVYLQTQLAGMQAKLERSDQALQDFARKHHVADLEDRVDMGTEKLRELHQKLTDVEAERLAMGVERDAIRAGRGESLAAIAANPLVRTLRQQRAEARADYAKLSAQFKRDYPTMTQLQRRIDELGARLKEEKQRVFDGILTLHHNFSDQADALRAATSAQEDYLLALNQRGVQYNILKREVDTNKELYDGLLQRMKEIGVASGAQENNVSIIDAATPPLEAAEPQPLRNGLLALVLGLLGGFGLALLLEFLDNTVRDTEEIEDLLALPALGAIPRAKANGRARPGETHLQRSLLSLQRGGVEAAEAFRSLRTSLMFASPEGMPKSLLVTSPAPAEGKTTVAANLAMVLAQSGEQVLLVDADLRHPRVHENFGRDQVPGFTQRIACRDLSGVACVHETEIEGLFVLTSGTLPPNPAEFLAVARTREVLESLGESFDYIILDGPPVLGLADVMVVAQAVQGLVVIASAGETRKQGLKHSIKRLAQVHAPVLGVVLNKVDFNGPDYSHYRGAGYSYYGYQAHLLRDPAWRVDPNAASSVRDVG